MEALLQLVLTHALSASAGSMALRQLGSGTHGAPAPGNDPAPPLESREAAGSPDIDGSATRGRKGRQQPPAAATFAAGRASSRAAAPWRRQHPAWGRGRVPQRVAPRGRPARRAVRPMPAALLLGPAGAGTGAGVEAIAGAGAAGPGLLPWAKRWRPAASSAAPNIPRRAGGGGDSGSTGSGGAGSSTVGGAGAQGGGGTPGGNGWAGAQWAAKQAGSGGAAQPQPPPPPLLLLEWWLPPLPPPGAATDGGPAPGGGPLAALAAAARRLWNPDGDGAAATPVAPEHAATSAVPPPHPWPPATPPPHLVGGGPPASAPFFPDTPDTDPGSAVAAALGGLLSGAVVDAPVRGLREFNRTLTSRFTKFLNSDAGRRLSEQVAAEMSTGALMAPVYLTEELVKARVRSLLAAHARRMAVFFGLRVAIACAAVQALKAGVRRLACKRGPRWLRSAVEFGCDVLLPTAFFGPLLGLTEGTMELVGVGAFFRGGRSYGQQAAEAISFPAAAAAAGDAMAAAAGGAAAAVGNAAESMAAAASTAATAVTDGLGSG